MGFNVNGNGVTTEVQDTLDRIRAFADQLAQKELTARETMVAEALSNWDGTFNANDIDHLMTALEMAGKRSYEMAMQVTADVDLSNVTTMLGALEVVAAAKTVMQDCIVLHAKLRHVLETHPHTMSVTPF